MILNLEFTFVTKDILKTIRQYLNLTLEELSMSNFGYNGFLELKKMARLKILNVYHKHGEEESALRLSEYSLMIDKVSSHEEEQRLEVDHFGVHWCSGQPVLVFHLNIVLEFLNLIIN